MAKLKLIVELEADDRLDEQEYIDQVFCTLNEWENPFAEIVNVDKFEGVENVED